VIDYVWGRPTEALLAAITGTDLAPRGSGIRLIQVGESAGPSISLPAAALRSSGLEIMGAGSGAVPPMDVHEGAFQQVMTSVNGYVALLARRRELQSTMSFTANRAPDAARLMWSGGLCSATREKAVMPSEAKNTRLLAIENPLDFLTAGAELTHLGTLSPQL